jgi:hypothetical protein
MVQPSLASELVVSSWFQGSRSVGCSISNKQYTKHSKSSLMAVKKGWDKSFNVTQQGSHGVLNACSNCSAIARLSVSQRHCDIRAVLQCTRT